MHRDRGNNALVFRLLDHFEIARHFFGRIGKGLFHLQPYHSAKLRWIDRWQAQTLREDGVDRQRENNVVTGLEQPGCLI